MNATADDRFAKHRDQLEATRESDLFRVAGSLHEVWMELTNG